MLSPDLGARRQVNRAIHHRPMLTAQQWFQEFYQPIAISPAIATFAYTYLENYSGIEFAYVVPSDRLIEDLRWIEVCWADWETTLCDDFWQTFGVDISDSFLGYSPSTVEDLIGFLNRQLLLSSSREL